MIERCHCGLPLHYTSPEAEAFTRRQVAELGEFVIVTVGERSFKVPRHYIALHGLNGSEVANLGFEELIYE